MTGKDGYRRVREGANQHQQPGANPAGDAKRDAQAQSRVWPNRIRQVETMELSQICERGKKKKLRQETETISFFFFYRKNVCGRMTPT